MSRSPPRRRSPRSARRRSRRRRRRDIELTGERAAHERQQHQRHHRRDAAQGEHLSGELADHLPVRRADRLEQPNLPTRSRTISITAKRITSAAVMIETTSVVNMLPWASFSAVSVCVQRCLRDHVGAASTDFNG